MYHIELNWNMQFWSQKNIMIIFRFYMLRKLRDMCQSIKVL